MKRIFNKFKTLLAAVLVVGAVGATGLALKSSESDALTIIRNCDPTAIIYCGATSVTELKNDYASRDGGRYPDIAAVYSYFGISASDIQNMGSTFKMGQVHKDGTVWLNGKQIGSGAVTAGRVNKPGSTAIPGTKAYARSTQVAFASDAIEAFIGFRNGSPAWAVLAGCGNPIKWNKPAIEIEKTVRNAANTAWVENDTFANGSTITYRLVVKNTGKAADTNVIVKDTLPSYNTFVAGSVKVNGVSKGAAGNSLLTSSGLNLGTVAAGTSVEITFQAKVSVATDKCGNTAFTNKAVVDGDKTSADEDTAGGNTNVVCAVVKCDALTASSTTAKLGDTVKYTASATLTNATLKSYEFKVNNVVVQNTASNVLDLKTTNVGTFTVKVTVMSDKGNATSAACEKTLTVTQEPVFKCDELSLSDYAFELGESTTATVKASATGATIKSYEFRVNGEVVQNTSSASYVFKPTAVGEYTIKATVMTDKGNATSAACEKKVKVTQVVDFKCVNVTASKLGLKIGETSVITVTAKLTNATLKSYEFSVDGAVVQDTTANSFNFSKDKAGEYTVSVKVVTDKGSDTNANCVVKINVSEEPKCPYDETLPADSPDCKKPEVCPYNENLPKDSPDCKKPPVVLGESTLPDTGAGTTLMVFVVAMTAGAAVAHSTYARRISR